MTINQRRTPSGGQQCEMMREEAANDNLGAEGRALMLAWARDRMHKPEWRVWAIRAMALGQS